MADLFDGQQAALALVNRLRRFHVEPKSLAPADVREAILSAGCATTIYGRNPSGRGAEDFEAAFERVFSEPLVAKKKRGRKSC